MSNPETLPPPTENVFYLHKLKKETYSALLKFCDVFFRNYHNFHKDEESKKVLRKEAEKIVQLENDNLDNLLEYIEYLMKPPYALSYLLVIHYLIGLSTNNLKKEFEFRYQKVHIGYWNTVCDFFPHAKEEKADE